MDIEAFSSFFGIPPESGISFYTDRNEFLTRNELWKKHAKGMTDAWHGWQACEKYLQERLRIVDQERDELRQRIEAAEKQEPVAWRRSGNFGEYIYRHSMPDEGSVWNWKKLYEFPVQSNHDLLAAIKLNLHYYDLIVKQQADLDMLGERLKYWESRGRACESNLDQLEQDFDNIENKSGMATSWLG